MVVDLNNGPVWKFLIILVPRQALLYLLHKILAKEIFRNSLKISPI